MSTPANDPRISNLAQRLKEVRETWFSATVNILDGLSTETEHLPGLEPISRELGGQCDRAIKAFQMFVAGTFIVEQAYLPSPDSHLFTEAVRVQVFGSQDVGWADLYRRYSLLQGDPEGQRVQFIKDMARFITGQDDQPLAFEAIEPGWTVLVLATQSVVAETLGDSRKAHELWPALGEITRPSD